MTDADQQVWDATLAYLRKEHAGICRAWFEELEPIGVSSGALNVRAHSVLHRDYLARMCRDAFNDALRSATGRLMAVRFLGPQDEPPAPAVAQGVGAGVEVKARKPISTVAASAAAGSGSGLEARSNSGLGAAAATQAVMPRTTMNGAIGIAARGVEVNEPAGDRPVVSGGLIAAGPAPAGQAGLGAGAGVDESTYVSSGTSAGAGSVGVGRGAGAGARNGAAGPETEEARGTPTGFDDGFEAGFGRGVASGGELREMDRPAPLYGLGRSDASAPAGGTTFGNLAGARDGGPANYESLLVNPDCGFANFVVGPENRLAHAAALAVADNPGRAYNPYFIHGGVGLGKSHLLQAICLQLAQSNPSLNIYYTSCDGFMTRFLESVQSGRMAEFRHRFREVDVLVIDDIHYLARKEKTQEEFFHTFNSLYQAQRQIILSSDAAPQEIPALEERLVSRFKWGLVCKIEPPLFETRAQIVKSKARLRGMHMPDAVAEFIAGRIDTNIRELEGAVVKIQMMSATYQRPVDEALAREAIGDAPAQSTREPSIQKIMSVVCDYYGVRIPDVQGDGRQRSIVRPRQVCMYFARKMTRMSFEEIGGYFGGRDHTTVMHAVNEVNRHRRDGNQFNEQLTMLEEKLTNDPGH